MQDEKKRNLCNAGKLEQAKPLAYRHIVDMFLRASAAQPGFRRCAFIMPKSNYEGDRTHDNANPRGHAHLLRILLFLASRPVYPRQ